MERRSGVDRRAVDRGTPDRRRPGRPRLPPEQRPQTIRVKLPADMHDALCRAAVRYELAVNAVVRRLVERAILTGEW